MWCSSTACPPDAATRDARGKGRRVVWGLGGRGGGARTLAVNGNALRVAAEGPHLALQPAQARLHVEHAPVASRLPLGRVLLEGHEPDGPGAVGEGGVNDIVLRGERRAVVRLRLAKLP